MISGGSCNCRNRWSGYARSAPITTIPASAVMKTVRKATSASSDGSVYEVEAMPFTVSIPAKSMAAKSITPIPRFVFQLNASSRMKRFMIA